MNGSFYGQGPVYAGLQMKMASWVFLLSFQGLTVWSLLARLWPGEGTPSRVSRSCGTGTGAPPTTAGEVAQTFRSHLEETPRKGQKGRLRNNEHLSNLSFAHLSNRKGLYEV